VDAGRDHGMGMQASEVDNDKMKKKKATTYMPSMFVEEEGEGGRMVWAKFKRNKQLFN